MKQLAAIFLSCTYLLAGHTAESQQVTVAAFNGAAPIVFIDENGEAAGIMPDLLERLIADAGYEAEVVTGLNFNEAFREVAMGRIDILPAAVPTEERLQLLDFNREPLVVAWGQLGVLPGNDIDGLLELRDRRIGMMRGGQNAANFETLMAQFDIPFEPVYFENFQEIVDAVEGQEVAAGVFFNTWFKSSRSVVPSSIVFSPTQGLVATAKGRNGALLTAIDQRLRELKADEGSYYYEILDRWLSNPRDRRIPQWVWITGSVILGALILALFFVLLLRRQVRIATREVELSRQRYRTVAEYAHGWEFWTDPEGTFVYVSPNTEQVTGYPALRFYEDESLMDRIILDEDLSVWQQHLDEIHTPAGDDRSACLIRIKTRDGETRWVEHRCTGIKSETGAYLGRRGSNIDITDRVVQQMALERNIREKEVMLQEIHHRVKNNLQVVSSLISLQKHSISDKAVLDQLDSIASRISTMGTLHSTIYREESFEQVEMTEYVESIVSQLRDSSVAQAEIDINLSVEQVRLELSAALPCGLIINEALTNAYKYAFPAGGGGDITVALKPEEGGHWRLSISDTGVGITSATPPDSEKGGIGFKLITALADQLGGTARWSSNGGTTVEVLFPMATGTLQSGDKGNPEAAGAPPTH